jgi:hypothetical protein
VTAMLNLDGAKGTGEQGHEAVPVARRSSIPLEAPCRRSKGTPAPCSS